MALIGSIALAVYWSRLGLFSNTTALQHYLGQSVMVGPIIFITIQIIQVVIPVIPGGISTAAGVLVFGPVWGFVYNYVGIAIGSIFNFLLARQFGKPFILHVISEKTYDKYIGTITEKKNFTRFFALAIFLPVAPDDVLCLMAGLTEMSLKKFTWIIILCKPASIIAYSFALVYGGQFLMGLF
ncbi:integral membrane protein [Latilactobacillus fuchuensis DSM 14340 = JCM 11249]|jgi:uncharacterized membrane protein YdjX (TVP38/TMEM64 family)|nr:integral membrane protein [Latilactobacillus fuchuensis DSM 14340 = JCM 11249]